MEELNILGYTLERISAAFPETYEVFNDADERVGIIRLLDGKMTVIKDTSGVLETIDSTQVYLPNVGRFAPADREKFLHSAVLLFRE